MTFLSPFGLAFLALVPVIIIFYVLRARYERIEVPSTLLWRNVTRDTEGRPSWRPPIRNILLLLQLLAVIVGALALARPATLGGSARNLIVILDASASMRATDVAPSRFEEAKRQASDLIRASADGDQFAIVRMGSAVDLVATRANRTQLINSIAELEPGVSGGDIRAALQVAGAIAQERSDYRTEVALFTDGTFGELPAGDAKISRLDVHTIGTSADNQAVVGIRVRRSFDGSNRYEGFATIANYGASAIDVPVRALADGVPVEMRQMSIPAEGSAELIVPLQQTVKLFEVSIERQDNLPIDNYAQVLVPSESVEVTLVAQSPQFLQRALAAIPNLKLTTVRPQQYKFDVGGAITIFDGWLPSGREGLPPGAALIVNPPPGNSSGFTIAELSQPQQVLRMNPRSALLDSVDLGGVLLPRAVEVTSPPGLSPAVESRDTVLVWEGINEGRKTVIFGFDPRLPEIGQRLAFPLMLANSISWLAPNSGATSIAPGQTIELQPLKDAADVAVRDPQGKTFVFPVSRVGQVRAIPFSQTSAIGRYTVVHRGPEGALGQSWFTVNAGDETHSNVKPKTFAPQVAPATSTRVQDAISSELWTALAAAALAVLSLEWLVYVRR